MINILYPRFGQSILCTGCIATGLTSEHDEVFAMIFHKGGVTVGKRIPEYGNHWTFVFDGLHAGDGVLMVAERHNVPQSIQMIPLKIRMPTEAFELTIEDPPGDWSSMTLDSENKVTAWGYAPRYLSDGATGNTLDTNTANTYLKDNSGHLIAAEVVSEPSADPYGVWIAKFTVSSIDNLYELRIQDHFDGGTGPLHKARYNLTILAAIGVGL